MRRNHRNGTAGDAFHRDNSQRLGRLTARRNDHDLVLIQKMRNLRPLEWPGEIHLSRETKIGRHRFKLLVIGSAADDRKTRFRPLLPEQSQCAQQSVYSLCIREPPYKNQIAIALHLRVDVKYPASQRVVNHA